MSGCQHQKNTGSTVIASHLVKLPIIEFNRVLQWSNSYIERTLMRHVQLHEQAVRDTLRKYNAGVPGHSFRTP